jgi:hypothetical protein
MRPAADSPRRSQPDDDKFNKPPRADAEERQWLGMPVSVLKERVSVLAGLMVVQSLSGIILARFEDMIQKHVVVTLFLTMLVGAGGNAGNQSTVNVIRGLATGQVNNGNATTVVLVESKMGLALGVVLASLAWARVLFTGGDMVSAIAIGAPAVPARHLWLPHSCIGFCPGRPPPSHAAAKPLRRAVPTTEPAPPRACRRFGLFHRGDVHDGRRRAAHPAALQRRRRRARRAGHPGAHGHRRRDDHVLHLRLALLLFRRGVSSAPTDYLRCVAGRNRTPPYCPAEGAFGHRVSWPRSYLFRSYLFHAVVLFSALFMTSFQRARKS